MNAVQVLPEPEIAPDVQGALLRTLALCDLVESTALVERLGDQAAAELIRKHDRLARAIMHRHGGHEIDKTDGFLVLFERPAQAVAFALEYQRALKRLGAEQGQLLRARIGIHVGDVVVWENTPEDIAQGAKPVEVEGLVKPVAARLMNLARPGQILLSGVAQSLAQRSERELAEQGDLRWATYGRFSCKGVAEPIVVGEVGEVGIAPLRMPASNAKVWRVMPWWRRPVSLIVAVLTLSLAVGVPLYLTTHSEPAIAFAERDWIVVGQLQNSTGETLFDASLDTAFRIGLEQSRYVNVVSDMQVRGALERMKRGRDAPLDRVTAAEVALREGARAVIVPTITVVGGHMRVGAEVIDPQNHATVYAEFVDAGRADSVLPSVDAVTRRLRGRLGEALASVETDSGPLARVTTDNLDALRAYSLGLRAQQGGRFADALALYGKATELDPNFALAYLGLARVQLSSDDRVAAQAQLRRAAALREHLPPREAIYLDALLASFGPPAKMLEKWRVMGNMYPDSFGAFANYALFAWQYTNQYADAIASAQKALSAFNPNRGSTHYLLGTLHLASDQYEAALQQLDQARALGGHGLGLVQADAFAAMRRFDRAAQALGDFRPSGIAGNDIFREIATVALAVDRGAFDDAIAASATARTRASALGDGYATVFTALDLSLRQSVQGTASIRDELARFADALLAAAGDAGDPYARLYALRFTAFVAARNGDVARAKRLVETRVADTRDDDYPNIATLRAMTEATLLLRANDAAGAVTRMRPRLDGNELFLARDVMMEAFAARGDTEAALAQAQWLATHRGRAWAEYGHMQVQRPTNVARANLAILRAAELQADLGRLDDARARLAEFRQRWAATDDLVEIARRVRQLDERLQRASSS